MTHLRHRVAVFIIDHGRILLLYRFKDGKEYYAVPGGGMKSGETEGQTAVREIKEETGLDIILGKKIDSLKINDSLESFYIADSFKGEPRLGGPEVKRQSPDNIYHLEWIPLTVLDNIPFRTEIKNIFLRYLKSN